MGSGRVFRALNKNRQLAGRVKTKGVGWADGNLTPQAIYYIVEEYVKMVGYINRKGEASLAAHDLRRTAAALAQTSSADRHRLQVTRGDFIQIDLALAPMIFSRNRFGWIALMSTA